MVAISPPRPAPALEIASERLFRGAREVLIHDARQV